MRTFTSIYSYDLHRFKAFQKLNINSLLPEQLIYLKNGLRVLFIHAFTDINNFMVFQTYIGFRGFGDSDLYELGRYTFKSVDELENTYKNNPDFIFLNIAKNDEETLDELREEYGKYLLFILQSVNFNF